VSQPPGFLDPKSPQKVYKVVKALYGLHLGPTAWYLKGKPKLGLWYPKESTFDLESYSDSDYAGANLDRKSTTGRLSISWQETHYLAMQKANHCSHLYNRSRICCCCKMLWASLMDSKSNVRL
ncbi:hypothetical protein Tco_0107341, partial [Tanacetum coccineum]